MAEHINMGVYQLENGNWAWRFTRTIDGKRVNRKGTKDADGNVLKSQKSAIRARQLAMIDFEAKLNEKPKHRMTVHCVVVEPLAPSVPLPRAAVTLSARSPILAYIQLPGQLLFANQRWTVSTISPDFGS